MTRINSIFKVLASLLIMASLASCGRTGIVPGGFDEENVTLTLGVVSDVHINTSLPVTSAKWKSALEQLSVKALETDSDGLDGVLVAGDLIDYPNEDFIEEFKRVYESVLDPVKTPLIYTVGNHDVLPLFCGEMEDAALEFSLADCFLLVCLTLCQAFADAEDDLEAVGKSEVNLLLEDFRSLVIVFATLAVTEDDVLCACALHHCCADFACVGTALLVGAVLSADLDDAVLQQFADGGEVDEGSADDDFAIGLLSSQDVLQFSSESYTFLQGLVHFPVACYDFLSHVSFN